MVAPGNGARARDPRAAAAPLIVEVEAKLVGEHAEGLQQVVVAGAWAAVQHDDRWPVSKLTDEERTRGAPHAIGLRRGFVSLLVPPRGPPIRLISGTFQADHPVR